MNSSVAAPPVPLRPRVAPGPLPVPPKSVWAVDPARVITAAGRCTKLAVFGGTRPETGQRAPARRAASATRCRGRKRRAAPPATRPEPRPEPRPVPTPAPKLVQPGETCKDKFFLAKQFCLQEECSKPVFNNSPACVKLREDAKLREDSKIRN